MEVTLAVDHQVQHRCRNDKHGHPLIQAQAAAGVGRVDTQPLDPEATGEVAGDIDGEQPPRPQLHPPVDQDQQATQRQIPQALVQERRVKQRSRAVASGKVRVVDLQPPRQCGGATEQFLVPPVTESTNGLRQRNSWHGSSQNTRHRQPTTPDRPGAHEYTGEQSAGNPQAAFPDLQPATGFLPRLTLVRDDVIHTRTEHAGAHRPHRNRAHVVACADTRLLHATTGEPHCGHHTKRDHQPIRMNRQRADVERAVGRAGDRRQQGPGVQCRHACSMSANVRRGRYR